MIADRIEGKRIDLFARLFELCEVATGIAGALRGELA